MSTEKVDLDLNLSCMVTELLDLDLNSSHIITELVGLDLNFSPEKKIRPKSQVAQFKKWSPKALKSSSN